MINKGYDWIKKRKEFYRTGLQIEYTSACPEVVYSSNTAIC